MFEDIHSFIRKTFNQPEGLILLHEPRFLGNEKKYVLDAIDSTYVSSVGKYVNRFEAMMAEITGAKYAVATVNGTSALHLALMAAGVRRGDEVITQALTFVATANAIIHAGAEPVFVDVDKDTMGMSPKALKDFLKKNAIVNNKSICINRTTRKRISACVPMHTFGLPLRIDEIKEICAQYHILLIEDAAESLGSYYKNKHTGSFGLMGTFSFNGNKTVTCGGGGAVITNDEELARQIKHISTTAKIPHPWEFVHDRVGFNYRMPNLAAALACAQLEQLDGFLESKRELAIIYQNYFSKRGIKFVTEIKEGKANHWLNAIIFDTFEDKEAFLKYTNEHKVMTRPIWRLMNKLPMYESCIHDSLVNSEWLEDRVVNIPSSVRLKNVE